MKIFLQAEINNPIITDYLKLQTGFNREKFNLTFSILDISLIVYLCTRESFNKNIQPF